jgi:hypothetical protein
LASGLDSHQEVVVIGEETEAAEARAGGKVEPLGAGENPLDDLQEIGVRLEEEPPVLGACRHLHQGASGWNTS